MVSALNDMAPRAIPSAGVAKTGSNVAVRGSETVRDPNWLFALHNGLRLRDPERSNWDTQTNQRDRSAR
jgi:hypothetical protein